MGRRRMARREKRETCCERSSRWTRNKKRDNYGELSTASGVFRAGLRAGLSASADTHFDDGELRYPVSLCESNV